jgi:hypothetical protein
MLIGFRLDCVGNQAYRYVKDRVIGVAIPGEQLQGCHRSTPFTSVLRLLYEFVGGVRGKFLDEHNVFLNIDDRLGYVRPEPNIPALIPCDATV